MKRLAPIAGAAALLLAPALAACGDADEATYEADATDESGGELIVNDADQPGVDVDLPKTPMTNVPADKVDRGDDSDASNGDLPE